MVNFERYPHFVGRDQLLSDLHTRLSDTSAQKYNHRVAIYGCGGIGKTQIAIEYTYRYAHFYENVFWISAKDQSALFAGFQEIANVTGCALSDVKPEEQAKVVLAWLRKHSRWLLVLDNLDDISVAKGYLPEMSEGHHTLITTRNPFSIDIPAEGFEIPLFGSEEAIELLRIRSETASSNFEAQVASEIVFELDHLPLAIEQAAAFIRKATKSLSEFLFIYGKSRKAFLQRPPAGNDTYSNSLAATFLLSFNKLKEMENGLRATKLLQLLSFLNPDGILIDVLRSGSEQPEHPLRELISDDLVFYETVETLAQFSLVRRSGGDMLIVHRLIQAVVKDGLTESEICAWRGKIVDMCDFALPHRVMIDEPFPNDVIPLSRLVSTQFLSPLLDAAEICNEKAATTLRRFGWFLQEDGKYDDSERLVQQSVMIYKRLFGEECENCLLAMNRLARIYNYQGRLKESGSLGRHVLEVSKRVLGEEHSGTLEAKDSLAVIYSSMGEFTEAVALGKAVLEARGRIFGEEHPDTLDIMSTLASTYWSMGKLMEAMHLEEKVFEAMERILGEEHLHTLTTKANLAMTYWDMGRLSEALALEKSVLEAREKILGGEHPHTLTTKANLAMTYKEMGKLKEAAVLNETVLEASRRNRGPAHPETLRDVHNRALIMRSMGNLEAAEELGRSAMESMEGILGNEHGWTLDAQSNVADILWDRGRSTDAISMKEQATMASQKALGVDHPKTTQREAELKEWKGTIANISILTDR
jgi:tetratricopeptide (TPR) repeat protein